MSAKFLSLLSLEYSILTLALIFSNSASVTLLASATATLSASAGLVISYLAVWAFSLIVNEPGSVAYELEVAVFSINAPSVSVAVA